MALREATRPRDGLQRPSEEGGGATSLFPCHGRRVSRMASTADTARAVSAVPATPLAPGGYAAAEQAACGRPTMGWHLVSKGQWCP